ncbi:MAG TPA: heat-inducible transcriptional repressor HrcA [Actinomycetota bacterium]|nr:heat-inducible transcriptional repressor HrcA [Actinomycetota bacterium]
MEAEPLDERRARVLRAVVQDHIRTGEPVGSRAVAERYRLRVSPATIRNDMAALERMGYLTHPHTSAGRIPTDLGYRFYVDTLPGLPKLADSRRRTITEHIDDRITDIEELMRRTAQVLSRTTHYAAVALPPVRTRQALARVDLVPVATGALLLAVTESGRVDRRMLETDADEQTLERVRGSISEQLTGLSLEEASLRADVLAGVASERERAILSAVARALETFDDEEQHVFIGGVGNIAGEEAFEHRDTLRQLFQALDEEASILRFLRVLAEEGEALTVRIGRENPLPAMREASVVLATYELEGQPVGTIAVIGPTRMQYPDAMSTVNAVSRRLSRVIESLGT